ncbi:hypothetical protein ACFQ6N_24830 [Kitasatospora sp. NPDC056446]|uniref:hypothetical protein n=1 Tax=Kitasatospora sp. NPDC056446 TaxID=3345819 RepID=UPI0036C03378
MARISRSLAVLAVAATAVLGGLAAAPAAFADAGEPPASRKCDVEYTVAYYNYKQLGYPELEALLHAEKTYNLCRVTD